MHVTFFIASALLALATTTSAAMWNVTVGGAAGLVYTPNQVTASVGDVVRFNFNVKNHTATQSAFNTPCQPLDGGFSSGLYVERRSMISECSFPPTL